MNNKEFISKLAKRCGITPAEAAAGVESFVAVMTERLKDNDQLNVSGFGVFEVKMRKERVSVNPKSGQRFLVPPKIVPAFRPSGKMKDKFND
ncbi:MAG: HU family DNA-binding protein [Bacteroidaceae bacterium]|nr:HU family DNA-binding protein [Bacteroidaceae bacterium]MBQ8365301.1 HU family DNA-binding protein [Bacteroidaceae bacterium]